MNFLVLFYSLEKIRWSWLGTDLVGYVKLGYKYVEYKVSVGHSGGSVWHMFENERLNQEKI